MHERAFVLMPLAALLPDAVIPGRGPVSTLMSSVAGQPVWRAD
jgi:7,8-dihydro-6-hydroxymethylpterin-pyrophosphokinase